MATISFKSVGKTTQQAQTEQQATPATVVPLGFKTPLLFGSGSLFEMHEVMSDQVHDNLRNLLLTNWGERLALYDFGANLRPLTTEFSSIDRFEEEAIVRIKNAVERWMPYVELEDFATEFDKKDNKNTAILNVTVTYNITQLNVIRRALTITLFVI